MVDLKPCSFKGGKTIAKSSAIMDGAHNARLHSEFTRTNAETLDSDLHLRIFTLGTSPNWYLQYTHPKLGQKRRSLRTRNKKEAIRRAWAFFNELMASGADGTPRRGPKIAAAIDGFLDDRRRVGREGSTIEGYRKLLNTFAAFCSRR